MGQPAAEFQVPAGVVHGTAVAFGGSAVLILGPSGAGKSRLALQLLGLGASLIADDQVLLRAQGGRCIAALPPGLPPLIEARGIGLLAAPMAGPTPVVLAVDLARAQAARLPPKSCVALAGILVDLISGSSTVQLAAAVRLYCLHGRKD